MPFFAPAYLSPDAGLFQLLSQLDQQPQQKTCVRRHHPARTIMPRFDVTEDSQAYELLGEVPGLEQKDLSIEFSDAQTLVIKGKIERRTTTHTSEINESATAQQDQTDNSSEKSHNPTVEDEYDAADTPLATSVNVATTTSTAAAAEKPATEEAKPETPKPTYWVAERRVGDFERKFSFAQLIDQDAVRASLKNGVLHVVVPKSTKARKVAVNVN